MRTSPFTVMFRISGSAEGPECPGVPEVFGLGQETFPSSHLRCFSFLPLRSSQICSCQDSRDLPVTMVTSNIVDQLGLIQQTRMEVFLINVPGGGPKGSWDLPGKVLVP